MERAHYFCLKKDKESQSTSNQFQFTEEQIESTNHHQFDPNLVQQSKEIINNSSDDLEFASENEIENTNVSSSAEFESENENDKWKWWFKRINKWRA